ncbi:hypothetical protein ACFWZ3_05505 [Frateuria sp. GZRR35]|uniref:hypothetical protein n=1 Tax=Frateuria TaxID=70411 RepID=UPI002260A53C|nr:hypothetical protein [Frateuria sp. STR12]MCX7515208.1 hypothetical protein [Frateuria sp. STR12]
MNAPNKHAPGMGASAPFTPFGQQSEEEQISQLIRLFALDPVLRTSEVIAVTGDTRTDFYGRQDPNDKLFDPSYPEPIGGRRSRKASRRYWTIDILRWRIRQARG